jgi:hypothetical protein
MYEWLPPDMRYRALCPLLVALLTIAGCSRQESVACNSDPRYVAARSAPPVQVPDDLSPPNESDALRLPPVAAASGAAGGCLQTPPSFFGESRPFQVSAESNDLSRRERRQARREQRRDEGGEATADRPATAPAESRDAPAAEDRVIEN